MAVDTTLKISSENAMIILSKLNNLFKNDNIDISADDTKKIQDYLEVIDEIDSTINKYEESDEDYTLSFKSNSDVFYGIGETCLLLDPFDNYRLFTLYETYDKDKYLNMSDGQKLYIVFRQGSREIRIPEYSTDTFNIKIDKSKGQVLFKITKKQVEEIISLRSKEFYITRVYETYSSIDDSYISSSEEVIFSGYWGERNSEKESQYLTTIENLQNLVDQKEASLQAMVASINELVAKNTQLSEDTLDAEKRAEDAENELENFKLKFDAVYGDGAFDRFNSGLDDENTGEIIDSRTILVNYNNISDENIKDTLDKITSEGDIEKNDDIVNKTGNNLEDIISM